MQRVIPTLIALTMISLEVCHCQSAPTTTTRYEYDTVGRLVKVTYPDSSTISYAYDRMGNILSISTQEPNTAPLAVWATIITYQDVPSALVIPMVEDPNVGDTHTFTILTQPTYGAALLDSNALRYTPSPGYLGRDSFTIRATDRGGLSVDGMAQVTVRSVSNVPADATPREYWLESAYPNPFTLTTTIRYGTSVSQTLTLKIIDMNGKLIAHLVDCWHEPGEFVINWTAERLPSGMYLCQLSASGKVRCHRLLHVK